MKMNYKERLQLLHERLEHINTPDLSELDEAMEKDEHLRELMETPIGSLPESPIGLSYKYFSNLPDYMTLYNALSMTLESFFMNGNFFYSKAGDQMVGFLGYEIAPKVIHNMGPYIRNISAISFDLDKPNAVLVRDTITEIMKLRKQYYIIRWTCFPENPANEMYEKFCRKLGGEIKEIKEEGYDLIEYIIYGEMPQSNLIR